MAEETPPEKKPVFLTPRQVAEVYERYDTGKYSQEKLAGWFGCSVGLINKLMKEREMGKPRVTKPLESREESFSIKAAESCLGAISSKIEASLAKVPDNAASLPLLNRTAKTMLDIRRQLKELPKDIHRPPVVMDPETVDKLAELIPAEDREEFVTLMRSLAQPQGQPESDLAEDEDE